MLDGVRYYAGVWAQNVEGLGTVHDYNLTAAQFTALFDAEKLTRMPIDVDIYPYGSGLRWAVIWVDNPGIRWAVKPSMNESQFDYWGNTYNDDMRLLVHDSAMDGDVQLHAAIWIQNTNGRGWWLGNDLSYQEYLNAWYRMNDEGYRLISDERYETADGPRYSQVWRQNSDRPTWKLKPWIDALIEQEIADFDVPGISAAIIHNGEFLYLRGFGFADVDNSVALDSQHVMRLASVSKGVAGVLTMRLVEDGDLGPDPSLDSIQTHLPGLPDHHQYTIQELVSNRGCVGHYAANEDDPDPDQVAVDNEMATGSYITAMSAAAMFWDDPLVCVPGESKYSTHGYTILGGAFEAAAGQSIFQVFDDRLHDPFDLGTLRPEDQSDTSVRRTKLYNTDNGEATKNQTSWKVLGRRPGVIAGRPSPVRVQSGPGGDRLPAVAGHHVDQHRMEVRLRLEDRAREWTPRGREAPGTSWAPTATCGCTPTTIWPSL